MFCVTAKQKNFRFLIFFLPQKKNRRREEEEEVFSWKVFVSKKQVDVDVDKPSSYSGLFWSLETCCLSLFLFQVLLLSISLTHSHTPCFLILFSTANTSVPKIEFLLESWYNS